MKTNTEIYNEAFESIRAVRPVTSLDIQVIERAVTEAQKVRRYWLLERTNRATRKQMYIAVSNFQLEWVGSIDKALQLARRKDADDLCDIVEEATQVVEYTELFNEVLIEQIGPVCWLPTPENINALPDPIRKYVHDLETKCDHAGDVRTIAELREQVRCLSRKRSEK